MSDASSLLVGDSDSSRSCGTSTICLLPVISSDSADDVEGAAVSSFLPPSPAAAAAAAAASAASCCIRYASLRAAVRMRDAELG